MKALITGATGHIGCHLVRACGALGVTPVALARPGSERRGLLGLDVQVCEGDVLDAASLERAMHGVGWVFHAAAVHRNWAADDATFMQPAVAGTANVVAAARAAGVKRVVHTSTGATVGFADDPERPIDEGAPAPQAKSVYVRAKQEAERVVLQANGAGLEVVVVNPSGVFGPRDYRLTPATRAIVGLLQGDPSMLGVCLTDVRDVARAHVLAAQRGKPGERYLLTGDSLSPAQVSQVFAEVCGIEPKAMRPPRFVLRLIAGMQERSARKSGQDAAVTRDQIDDVFGKHLCYDSRKARSELGATFRSAPEVVRDAVRWLLFVEALKPKTAAKLRAKLGADAAPDSDWVR